ncbi:MAG: hypothetical protein K0Q78_1626 [Cellvibrio sp.]|jgi:hypothetical protein|nr:hypothetical protein [Cellvibrio sp.]
MKRFLLAISAVFFSISSYAQVYEAGLSGGMGGSAFRDSAHTDIQSVTLCGGSLVDSIKVTYVDGSAVKHGGNGGSCSTLNIRGSGVDSRLVSVKGCYNGNTINSLTLGDANGTTITKGGCTGLRFEYTSDNIIGFKGRSATLLDAIGVISSTQFKGYAGPSGSKGGDYFYAIDYPINHIKVCSGTKIDSIWINGSYVIGGSGGKCQELRIGYEITPINYRNYITKISGHYNNNGLINILILTRDGTSLFAGPETGFENFSYDLGPSSVFGQFGIHGKAGSRIDSIGVIYPN